MKKIARYIGINLPLLIFAGLNLSFVTLANSTEPDRLEPDRPGYSWGTHTVAAGSVYIETGYQFNRVQPDTRLSNFPVLNVRFGVINRFEGFVSWEGFEIYHREKAENPDVSLPAVGFKLNIINKEKFSATVIGLTEIQRDKPAVLPAVALTGAYNPFGELNLFGMAGIFSLTEQPQLTSAAGFGFALSGKTNLTFEYYNTYNTHTTLLNHGNEAGIIHFLNNNLQFDMYFGLIHGQKPDFYSGIGFAIRI
jgi:hypothetical protein